MGHFKPVTGGLETVLFLKSPLLFYIQLFTKDIRNIST
jgi:hypothetical protein